MKSSQARIVRYSPGDEVFEIEIGMRDSLTWWGYSGDTFLEGFKTRLDALKAMRRELDKRIEEQKRLKGEVSFEYADPKYGNAKKVDSGYSAIPNGGKQLTFPTLGEAVKYLQSVSREHRYIRKKR
jgi:hypothetical protein